MAPLIDRCSLIGKGVGFFTAFFRDSALRESRLSVQFWVQRVLVEKLHLGRRNRVRDRLKKSVQERERID